jgi:ketosteroid isomerase-like protein
MHTAGALSLLLALAIPVVAGAPAAGAEAGDTPEALVQAFVLGMNHADVTEVVRLFAPDATAFLPFDGTPVRLTGRDALAAALGPLFADLRRGAAGPEFMHLVARDVLVQPLGEVAVVTFDVGSGPVASRRTLVVRRTPSGWRIVHLHASNLRPG